MCKKKPATRPLQHYSNNVKLHICVIAQRFNTVEKINTFYSYRPRFTETAIALTVIALGLLERLSLFVVMALITLLKQ
jgi:hypothetical protein